MRCEREPIAHPPNSSYYAGLDVHQKSCDIALIDPTGQLVRRWHVKTCPKSLDQLARELKEECRATAVALALEASTAGKAVCPVPTKWPFDSSVPSRSSCLPFTVRFIGFGAQGLVDPPSSPCAWRTNFK
jgi:hypothetical protein